MSPQEQVKVLREAFPADRDAPLGRCAWCGDTRRRRQALCRNCWYKVPGPVRHNWRSMTLVQAAIWILDNKPKVASA